MNTFHEGERAVQERAGVRQIAERVGGSIGDALPPVARQWLGLQRLGAVAALAPDGRVWAQILSGQPGFLSAPDLRTLQVITRFDADDPLRAALEHGGAAGAIVLEPAARRRMRFNGRAQLEENRLSITAREVYSNCPKFIQARTVETEIGTEVGTEVGSPAQSSRAQPRLRESGSSLNDVLRAWISAADTFFIGSIHAHSGGDCSHRGGNPGFVQVEGNTLSWADYAGNAMFNTLGNLALDGRAGLVFADWQSGATLQLAGQARILPARASDERRIEFEVRAWRQVDGVLPLSWHFEGYSPFNP